MKRHIPLVLLLTVVLCLSGCAGRPEPPTSAAESEKSTQMTTEETTMSEIDTTEPILFLTIDGAAVDVQWENNAAVAELYNLAQNAITVNTSAYGSFEQVGSLPQSLSRSDAQMTTQPGDIVLYRPPPQKCSVTGFIICLNRRKALFQAVFRHRKSPP